MLRAYNWSNETFKQSSMDIDDILAEVDGHPKPQEAGDLQELTRAWVTERSAPEVLPWPEQLMERMMDRIRQQVNYMNSKPTISRN